MTDANSLTKERRRAVMPICGEFIAAVFHAWPDAQYTATENGYVWRHNQPSALQIAKRNLPIE